jgi:hypothetical protein
MTIVKMIEEIHKEIIPFRSMLRLIFGRTSRRDEAALLPPSGECGYNLQSYVERGEDGQLYKRKSHLRGHPVKL